MLTLEFGCPALESTRLSSVSSPPVNPNNRLKPPSANTTDKSSNLIDKDSTLKSSSNHHRPSSEEESPVKPPSTARLNNGDAWTRDASPDRISDDFQLHFVKSPKPPSSQPEPAKSQVNGKPSSKSITESQSSRLGKPARSRFFYHYSRLLHALQSKSFLFENNEGL